MQNLLFLSKAFCLVEGASTIGLNHFAKALAYVEITHPDAATYLTKRFPHVHPTTRNGADALLALAKDSEEKLHIAETLMPILRRLEGFENFYVVRGSDYGTDLPPALLRAKQVRDVLEREVFGQDKAIAALSSSVARQTVQQSNQKSVAGLYLLAGPSGTGKSLAASLLASGLGGKYKTFVFDMSALSNPNDECSLIGTQKHFSNSGPGLLTKFVHDHSHTVVVLDGICKAHPNIQNSVFQLLDTGYLVDQFGLREGERSTKVDFQFVHLVLITDIGGSLYDNPGMLSRLRTEGGQTQVKQALMQALAAARNGNFPNAGPAFSPALLSRLQKGEVVLFNRLEMDSLRKIAQRGLEQARKTFSSVSKLKYHNGGEDYAMLDLLILGQTKPDARHLSEAAIYNLLFVPLEQELLRSESKRPGKFCLIVEEQAGQALTNIRHELGSDPVHQLFRLNKRIAFGITNATTRSQIELRLGNVRLERVTAAADFGKGGFAIEVPATRFADVAGHEKLKTKLREHVALLRDPSELKRRGLEPARGMLLHGAPGTGKTLIARALAHEANMPFMSVVATELFNLDLLRELFAKLRKYAPAILFIDELDALGRRGQNGADPVINTLLAEIDGFIRTDQPIFVIGATNFPNKVDPALLRPGRMEKHYEVDELDRTGRARMLERLEPIVAPSVSIDKLVSYTAGLTGAQMESALREAHMRAIGGTCRVLDDAMLRDVFDSIRLGESGDDSQFSQDTIEHAAYHEAGHALALALLMPQQRIESLSIGARSNSLGRVAINAEKMTNTPITRRLLKDQLVAYMAGRAAEIIRFGEEEGLDNGSADDLRRATQLTYRAITEFGLDPEIGAINLAGWKEADMPLPNLHQLAETRLRVWLKEAESAALDLLRQNGDTLKRIADTLLAEEALDGERFLELLAPRTKLVCVA